MAPATVAVPPQPCHRGEKSVGEAHHRARPPPEVFEPVVLALLWRKDVHDEVTEIEQQPAAIRRPLPVAQADALRPQVALEVIGECVKLEWRLRRGDDKVVSKGRGLRNIDQRDIQRLAFREDIDRAVCQRFRIQTALSLPVRAGPKGMVPQP